MAKKQDLTPILALGALALLAAAGSSKTVRDVITPLLPGATPTLFTLKMWPYAVASEKATGVPALVTLAQAGLESGFGKAAYGNNFFGIKAGSSWKGRTQELKTWECGKTGIPAKDGITDKVIAIYPPGDSRGICGVLPVGGVLYPEDEGPALYDDIRLWEIYSGKYAPAAGADQLSGGMYSYRVYGKFRAYNTPAEGFADHGRFLRDNSRYAKAFAYRDPKLFATEIARAGYATAPTYASALHKMIDQMAATILKA